MSERSIVGLMLPSLLVLCAGISHDAYGVGISPARWSVDVTENSPGVSGSTTYNLTRGGTRYSSFRVTSTAGLQGTVTGFSASAGVESAGSSAILIDWDTVGAQNMSVYLTVSSPDPWSCPAEPGGSVYYDSLVTHADVPDPTAGIVGVAAVVSQMALYRNYAPRTTVLSRPETVSAGQTLVLDLEFEDKASAWFNKDPNRTWFTYHVDWDGGGIPDESGGVPFDESPVPDSRYPSLSTWTSGVQTSTLSLNHAYLDTGDWMASVTVVDVGGETTSLQIPIAVVPEPMCCTMVGFALQAIARRRGRRRSD